MKGENIKAPDKKIGPIGFISFSLGDTPCSRGSFINRIIEQGGRVYTFAPCEIDNQSKSICSDGNRIWVEDHFGNYVNDL